MRCLSCNYDLSNLTTGGVHRCPECGRIFDAADPQTFAAGPTELGWIARLAVIIVIAVSVSLLVVWLTRVLY